MNKLYTISTLLLLLGQPLVANNCSLGIDLLYWRANPDQAYFMGSKSSATNVDEDGIRTFSKELFHNNRMEGDLEPGVSLSLVWKNPRCRQWDFATRYRYYGFSIEERSQLDFFLFNPSILRTSPQSSIEFSDTPNLYKWDLDTHTLDFGLRHSINIGRQVELIQETAFRIQWFDSLFRLKRDFTLVNGETLVSQGDVVLDRENKQWGLGPSFRLDGNWNIGCGFGLTTHFGTSLLYRTAKSFTFSHWKRFDSPNPDNDTSSIFDTRKREHVRSSEAQIEVGFGGFWNFCLFRNLSGTLMIRWDHEQYLRRINDRDNISLQGLTFSGKVNF